MGCGKNQKMEEGRRMLRVCMFFVKDENKK